MSSLKYEQPYINYLSYFQQWNFRQIQNWGFLSVGLRLHYQVFANSQRDFVFQFMKKIEYFVFEI